MICIKVKVDLRSQAFTIRRAGGHGPRRKGCKMPSSKQMEKHGRLVARMADRLGTDLDEAELRLLEEIRYELNIDRLHAAAIERGARARHLT